MGLIGWLLVAAAVLAVISLAAGRSDDEPRIILWGDSLAWESRDAFVQAVKADGVTEWNTRTWGGTALCDWLPDIRKQARRWEPTVAVLSFSGNTATDCMRDRDVLTAYREDATEAVDVLTRRGITVVLVEAPPREDQHVGPDGRTELDQIWHDIAEGNADVRVAAAARTLTDQGRYVQRLPCEPGEDCDPDGTVPVRSPDGVHFCPIEQPPMGTCPVRAPGAERYGRAMAAAALAAP